MTQLISSPARLSQIVSCPTQLSYKYIETNQITYGAYLIFSANTGMISCQTFVSILLTLDTKKNTDARTLVFVDDDKVTSLLIERFLKAVECNVVTFSDTDEARSYIADNSVHILIVDLRMPKIDGIDFIAGLDLSSRQEKIEHIILQTGAEPEANIRALAETAGYELLLKDELLSKDRLKELVS